MEALNEGIIHNFIAMQEETNNEEAKVEAIEETPETAPEVAEEGTEETV